MKNKGFTLVELLGVMIILSIIVALVLPTISDTLKKGKETVHDTQINKILNAAYDYTINKTNLLPNYNETNYVILSELKKEGYVDSSIIDSETNKEFPNDIVISIKNVGNDYDVRNSKTSSKRGNYLYTVELDLMKTPSFKSNRPQIVIDGYEEGALVYNANIGTEFVYPSYSATSSSNIDITNRVVQNIIYDSKIVDSIDVYTAGIYYINYCVVDLNGYSNCEVLSVIISDIQAPSLTIPSNIAISTSVTSFDLMEGVSCIDNSGKCNIKINGNINFGHSGSYIIEYNASDPSGNTASEKRVITVE